MRIKHCLYFLLTPLLSQSLFGAVVITVDISDISAVTFTASTENASAELGLNSVGGISLIDFLPGNSNTADGAVGSGSLDILISEGGGSRIGLDRYYINNGDGYTSEDLTFYSNTNEETIVSTTEQALSGSLTLNLTGFTLPSIGSTGQVGLGARSQELGFGEYQIVPEPMTYSLFVGCVSLLLVIRRKSKRA